MVWVFREERGEMMDHERRSSALTALVFFIAALTSYSWAGSDYETIDAARLHSMVVDNAYELEGGRTRRFTIIDIRAKEQYDQAHIFSAINVPESDVERSEGPLQGERGAFLVVYGNSLETVASERWAEKARISGHTNVAIYSEGFQVWKRKGMPVASLREN